MLLRIYPLPLVTVTVWKQHDTESVCLVLSELTFELGSVCVLKHTAPILFAVPPLSYVLVACGVNVEPLAVLLPVQPLAVVLLSSLEVCVATLAVLFVVDPVSFVFVAVDIQVAAPAMLRAFPEFSIVTFSVGEDVDSLPVEPRIKE